MTANDRNIKRARRRKRKRRLRKGFIAFLIIVPVAVVAILSVTVFFPVKSVEVSGKSIYRDEQIISKLGIKSGDKFIPTLFNGSKGRLLKSFPYIESVSYGYSLSGKLTLKIKSRAAAIQFRTGDEYAVAAGDTTVLEIVSHPKENLPVYNIKNIKCEPQNKVKFELESQKGAFNELREAAEEYKIPVKEADFNTLNGCEFTTADGITVRLGEPGTYGAKMRMAAKILKDIPDEESGTIDFSAWTPENKKASYMVKNDTA